MTLYLAHSSRNGCLAQSYKEHVSNVYRMAREFAEKAERFAVKTAGQLKNVVSYAAEYHDLGKLDAENQQVLSAKKSQKALPVNHVDAGVAACLKQLSDALFSALAVYAHHKGLPDYPYESMREHDGMFRDERPDIRKRVDGILQELKAVHRQLFTEKYQHNQESYNGKLSVFLRLVLSCLADADHTDTAKNYKQYPEHEETPSLKAAERLAALDSYVAGLEEQNERSRLRKTMYETCRDSEQSGSFSYCDSPVGSGKTTAVMAHLLKQADKRGLRRIFVILPYTNIISQSVNVYRRALILPGEKPEEVVAELHHRADFENEDLRYLTALWRAPIVVTTAVAFFETLASSRPASLRRLHELPGSAVFVDESHAALPLRLLPLAWYWIKIFGEEWGCYWLLASGSLVHFWKISELTQENASVPNLINSSLVDALMKYEANRIKFCWQPKPLGRSELLEWVVSCKGPRLVIVNTVQSAAVLADDMANKFGKKCVEHLSSALTPEDRADTIERIKHRLSDCKDKDWSLIATSCVEAGVDFSFCTGFREAASLLSLLQTAGRVNRGGNVKNAEIYSFVLQDDTKLKRNPGVEDSALILRQYFEKGLEPSPELCTSSIKDELQLSSNKKKNLCKLESNLSFKKVEKEFRVIDSDTVAVVVDKAAAEEFRVGRSNWKILQKKSVSIARYNLDKYMATKLCDDLYRWELSYDSFLGYMRGILYDIADSSLLSV